MLINKLSESNSFSSSFNLVDSLLESIAFSKALPTGAPFCPKNRNLYSRGRTAPLPPHDFKASNCLALSRVSFSVNEHGIIHMRRK